MRTSVAVPLAVSLAGALLLGLGGCKSNPNATGNHDGYGRFPTDSGSTNGAPDNAMASAEAIDPYADVSWDAIRKDLTPELMTLSERPVDVSRNMAVVGNINLRAMWNDLGRAWLFDQPSILNPYPVYGFSGQPN